MSYHVYAVNGYGISDEREDLMTTREKVEDLLATTRNLEKTFHDSFGFEYSIEDIDDYESECGIYGLFGLLCDVINENEHVEFWVGNDFDGLYYILYTPTYPWFYKEEEKNISEKDIEDILNKYTTILFGHPFDVDYYRCENGG